jgi:hypothetical protein
MLMLHLDEFPVLVMTGGCWLVAANNFPLLIERFSLVEESNSRVLVPVALLFLSKAESSETPQPVRIIVSMSNTLTRIIFDLARFRRYFGAVAA